MKKREIVKREDLKRWEKCYDFTPKHIAKGLEKKIFTEINNGYNAHVYIDEYAELWVAIEKLHTFLRTTKSNAKYIVQRLNRFSRIEVDGVEFIQMAELAKLIFKKIEQTGNHLTRTYLKFSEDCIKQIREDPAVINLRRDYEDIIAKELKSLKRSRIREFNIKRDELTGEELEVTTAEFSHIRSKSIFPQFSTEIRNGLIVNKSTHKIITSFDVYDEDDLLMLCRDKGWDESWYDEYLEYYG